MNCEYCNIELEHQRIILENKTCMYLQLIEPEIEGSGIKEEEPETFYYLDITIRRVYVIFQFTCKGECRKISVSIEISYDIESAIEKAIITPL